MAATTSYIGTVTVSRVIRTSADSPQGFGNTGAPKITKEVVEDINIGVRADSAADISLKIAQALTLLDGSAVTVTRAVAAS